MVGADFFFKSMMIGFYFRKKIQIQHYEGCLFGLTGTKVITFFFLKHQVITLDEVSAPCFFSLSGSFLSTTTPL